jgi:ABC-type lipoprotein release transport system permease subunit
VLPLAWWKLGFLWLFNVKSRTPPARRTLVKGSFRTAVAGLALSVAAVAVSLALFAGFERVLALSVIRSLGHYTHFTKWRTRAELEKFVREAPPGVKSATFFWTSQGLLVGPKGGRGVLIEGRSDATLADSRQASSTETAAVSAGPATRTEVTTEATPIRGAMTLPNPEDLRVEVDLGKPLAETLGVKQGDSLRVLLPGVLRGAVEARVRSLLEFGMHDIDSRLAVIDDASLRAYLEARDPDQLAKRPGDAHGIRFVLDETNHDPSRAEWVEAWGADYRARLDAAGEDERHALFKNWQELQKNLFGSLGLDRQVVVTVMGLLTLVATLNVAATLVVLFLERDRELAILQAVGLSPRKLLAWIGIQGLIMGVVASLVGLGLARVFGWAVARLPLAQLPPDIYHVRTLPLYWSWAEQLGTFGFGVAAALGAALLLGLRLSRTPVLGVLGQRR